MKVEQILQSKGTDVFAVEASATVQDAIEKLGAKNVGAVLVTDEGGAVTGILSERDVVRHMRKEGAGVLQRPVSACMTPDPIACTPDTEIDTLMAEMTHRRIRHLPVMKDGALCGLVSIGDIVKRKIELAEQEAEELRQYIASG